jgi:tetratricopeptide (TPR) repeat protein
VIAALVDAGRLTDASELVTGALARAVFTGDTRSESRARVDQQLVRLHVGTSGGHEQARQIAEVALAHLELHGDNLGQCRAWRLQAWIDWIEGRLERADEAWQRAAVHARRAGDARELFDILGWRASAAVLGPTPVADAILRCDQIREYVRHSPVAVALTLHPLGLLHAMTGDFELAHELIREGNESLGELGRMESAVSHHEAIVELMAGRPDLAEQQLRPGYDALERMGERELLSTTAAILAQAVYAQGRCDEADELCGLSERIAASEDVVTQIMWRGMRARLAAREGDAARAETFGREAVRLAESTDLLVLRGDAWLDLEDVARHTGRPADARAAAQRALEHYERKGDQPSAARARARVGPSEERGEPARIR